MDEVTKEKAPDKKRPFEEDVFQFPSEGSAAAYFELSHELIPEAKVQIRGCYIVRAIDEKDDSIVFYGVQRSLVQSKFLLTLLAEEALANHGGILQTTSRGALRLAFRSREDQMQFRASWMDRNLPHERESLAGMRPRS